MNASSDGARADARKARLGAPADDAAAELRVASRRLLNAQVSVATGHSDPLAAARAWDLFALALDAAEDAAR